MKKSLPKYIIGIDPGLKGSICIIPLTKTKSIDAYTYDMPITTVKIGTKLKKRIDVKKVQEIISYYTKEFDIQYIGLEHQQSRPFADSTSSDTLLLNYGLLLSVIILTGVRFKEYTPQSWQKIVKKGVDECNGVEGKELSMCIAKSLFPDADVDRHDTAEALLLAETVRREIADGSIVL